MLGYLHCMCFKSIWMIDRRVGRREANIRFENGTNIKSYWSESFGGHIHSHTVWVKGLLFLYSFWWLWAPPPSSVSWRCRGGWGHCYPFINRCCSRCLCLLSRSAPTMICCCWTRTICWSTWLLNRMKGRRWGGVGTEREKVTQGIGREYGFGDAFLFLPQIWKNMRRKVLFCGFRCFWQEMSDSHFIMNWMAAEGNGSIRRVVCSVAASPCVCLSLKWVLWCNPINGLVCNLQVKAAVWVAHKCGRIRIPADGEATVQSYMNEFQLNTGASNERWQYD